MARHHKRLKQTSKLNLVSLMDIFTILVFFLLVNSSDVEVLQSNKSIKLPESVAEKKPDATLVVMLNQTDIVVAGRSLVPVATVLGREENDIKELTEELEYQASRRPLTESEKKKGRAVTIMGDESIPYALLKRIMTTCAAADYRDISLAVTRVAPGTPDAEEGLAWQQ
ncbi:biopolymer transporter ExbD [Exilibacterium tricleocarpae]|uniref:Biopolymer transporter ExbD n=2 Tax=Exilibacterium tricleocarpae TaxID=2591008 RepID=A0A545TZT9_9GAMM|nr:biopolymer transporter ExbD [Exilibacterium tricleocarpae]